MRVFDATAAFTEEDRNLVGPSGAERVSVLSSTRGLLEMLDAPPIMGRTFTEHDWDAAHNDVAMLSYSLFASRFSARPGNLGWTIRLGDRLYTVVGVMKPGFEFAYSVFRVRLATLKEWLE